jgi:hypothetical protein
MPELRSTWLALAAGTVLLTGACGHTTVVGASRTLQLSVTEYRVAPQKVEVPAGPLTIVVHNYGLLSHNLSVSHNGESEGATQPIAPGGTAVLTLTLSPGHYVMASTVLSDETLGVYGTLIVNR